MERHQHSTLIHALGGYAETAKAAAAQTGKPLDANTVRGWLYRGIARDWRPTIAAIARVRGVEVPAGFLRPGSNTGVAA